MSTHKLCLKALYLCPKMTTTMEIGQKIKKVRELRNFTQEYMATQIGMTQESYSKIEANRNNVSITKLEKISQILEVGICDLLNFDEKKVLLNINENNQQNAQIGYFGEVETLKTLYDKIIEQQRSEIDFLRSLLKDKS